jgi:calcium-dependent protein kinase
MSLIIFINDKADSLKNVFMNRNWKLEKIFNQVYSIIIDDEKTGWLLKYYKNINHATIEKNNLMSLEEVDGVPKLLSSKISNQISYLVMSKMPGLDLIEYIQKNGIVNIQQLKNITKQLLTILKVMHEKKIIHADIKPENIIYDAETEKASMIDFETRHTAEYCSPEQIFNLNITSKTDIWSLGVTLYTIHVGLQLFSTKDEILSKQIDLKKIKDLKLKGLLLSMIDRNPTTRYNVVQSLNHPFLRDE